jgi:branched-chain amino acid transport system ATP-binding protein
VGAAFQPRLVLSHCSIDRGWKAAPTEIFQKNKLMMNGKNTEPIIETKDLTIRFGGHVAVDHVSIQVEPFTLKSIIGPNGAGKTTFFNLLTGQYKPTGGKVFFKGQDITVLGSAMRTRLGMGRSFQLTNIFPVLSVLENVRVAIQSRKGFGLNFWRNYLYFSETEDEAYSILQEMLLDDKWVDPASSLTHGEQRKLELAILMALEPKVLFLDEPTAGMSQEEVPAILEVLEKIKSSRDRTILLVEHKMDMIMALSDSIAVLQDGRLIADGDPDAIHRSKEVQDAYLGGGAKLD